MDYFLKLLRNKYYQGAKSDHFDGERFYNKGVVDHNSFKDFIRWKLTTRPTAWPKSVVNKFDDVPPPFVDDLRVSWIGHSSFLIQTQGMNFLIDPIYSNRASPFRSIGPKRVCVPGIKFDNLPKIDVLLITHNHYDHLDLDTIQNIWQRDRCMIITPLGNDVIIKKFDRSINVIAKDLGEHVDIEDVSIILEPAIHWSARGLFDRNRALWASFVISSRAGNLYLSGDSAYGSHFKAALLKYKQFRFAILPIGAYEPRWFMKQHHMDYEDAMTAFKDLDMPYTVPSHFQTFQLTDEGYGEPLDMIYKCFDDHKIDRAKFHPLNIGEHWYIP